jgi:hypothetical protein
MTLDNNVRQGLLPDLPQWWRRTSLVLNNIVAQVKTDVITGLEDYQKGRGLIVS